MTFDDYGWPIVYFAMGLGALGLAWWAQSWRAIYLAALMLMSAISTDVINWTVDYARAPMIQPETDALIAVAVAGVAAVTRSRLAWFVLGCFVIEGALWIAFFAMHIQGSRFSIEILNGLFAVTVLGIGIGGAGVRLGLADWLRGSHPGVYRRLARG